MKIIEPSYEIMDKIEGNIILKRLELCGRVCYKSEKAITEESAKIFIQNIIKAVMNLFWSMKSDSKNYL